MTADDVLLKGQTVSKNGLKPYMTPCCECLAKGLQWKRNQNRGAVIESGLDANVTAVCFEDTTDNGQPESRAFGFRTAQNRREGPAL